MITRFVRQTTLPLAHLAQPRFYLRHLSVTATRMSFPKTIKAITIPRTGDVDVIEQTEQPFPEIKPGNVVIKVQVRRP
jgi:hypothetical protein